jgi:hypothetical protein
MRNRFVEGLAVVIGLALVVFYYVDHQPVLSQPEAAGNPVAPVAEPVTPVVDAPLRQVFPPVSEPPVETLAPAVEETASLAAAQAALETARAEVAALRGSLSRLDARFDEKDAEFARLESEGTDPEVLEEQRLIFLDSVVDEYDELEGRLAAAEAAEQQAAEMLEALGGNRS